MNGRGKAQAERPSDEVSGLAGQSARMQLVPVGVPAGIERTADAAVREAQKAVSNAIQLGNEVGELGQNAMGPAGESVSRALESGKENAIQYYYSVGGAIAQKGAAIEQEYGDSRMREAGELMLKAVERYGKTGDQKELEKAHRLLEYASLLERSGGNPENIREEFSGARTIVGMSPLQVSNGGAEVEAAFSQAGLQIAKEGIAQGGILIGQEIAYFETEAARSRAEAEKPENAEFSGQLLASAAEYEGKARMLKTAQFLLAESSKELELELSDPANAQKHREKAGMYSAYAGELVKIAKLSTTSSEAEGEYNAAARMLERVPQIEQDPSILLDKETGGELFSLAFRATAEYRSRLLGSDCQDAEVELKKLKGFGAEEKKGILELIEEAKKDASEARRILLDPASSPEQIEMASRMLDESSSLLFSVRELFKISGETKGLSGPEGKYAHGMIKDAVRLRMEAHLEFKAFLGAEAEEREARLKRSYELADRSIMLARVVPAYAYACAQMDEAAKYEGTKEEKKAHTAQIKDATTLLQSGIDRLRSGEDLDAATGALSLAEGKIALLERQRRLSIYERRIERYGADEGYAKGMIGAGEEASAALNGEGRWESVSLETRIQYFDALMDSAEAAEKRERRIARLEERISGFAPNKEYTRDMHAGIVEAKAMLRGTGRWEGVDFETRLAAYNEIIGVVEDYASYFVSSGFATGASARGDGTYETGTYAERTEKLKKRTKRKVLADDMCRYHQGRLLKGLLPPQEGEPAEQIDVDTERRLAAKYKQEADNNYVRLYNKGVEVAAAKDKTVSDQRTNRELAAARGGTQTGPFQMTEAEAVAQKEMEEAGVGDAVDAYASASVDVSTGRAGKGALKTADTRVTVALGTAHDNAVKEDLGAILIARNGEITREIEETKDEIERLKAERAALEAQKGGLPPGVSKADVEALMGALDDRIKVLSKGVKSLEESQAELGKMMGQEEKVAKDQLKRGLERDLEKVDSQLAEAEKQVEILEQKAREEAGDPDSHAGVGGGASEETLENLRFARYRRDGLEKRAAHLRRKIEDAVAPVLATELPGGEKAVADIGATEQALGKSDRALRENDEEVAVAKLMERVASDAGQVVGNLNAQDHNGTIVTRNPLQGEVEGSGDAALRGLARTAVHLEYGGGEFIGDESPGERLRLSRESGFRDSAKRRMERAVPEYRDSAHDVRRNLAATETRGNRGGEAKFETLDPVEQYLVEDFKDARDDYFGGPERPSWDASGSEKIAYEEHVGRRYENDNKRAAVRGTFEATGAVWRTPGGGVGDSAEPAIAAKGTLLRVIDNRENMGVEQINAGTQDVLVQLDVVNEGNETSKWVEVGLCVVDFLPGIGFASILSKMAVSTLRNYRQVDRMTPDADFFTKVPPIVIVDAGIMLFTKARVIPGLTNAMIVRGVDLYKASEIATMAYFTFGAAKGLYDAVEVYNETGYFSPEGAQSALFALAPVVHMVPFRAGFRKAVGATSNLLRGRKGGVAPEARPMIEVPLVKPEAEMRAPAPVAEARAEAAAPIPERAAPKPGLALEAKREAARIRETETEVVSTGDAETIRSRAESRGKEAGEYREKAKTERLDARTNLKEGSPAYKDSMARADNYEALANELDASAGRLALEAAKVEGRAFEATLGGMHVSATATPVRGQAETLPPTLSELKGMPPGTVFRIELTVEGKAEPEVWVIRYDGVAGKGSNEAYAYTYISTPYEGKNGSTGLVLRSRAELIKKYTLKEPTALELLTRNIVNARAGVVELERGGARLEGEAAVEAISLGEEVAVPKAVGERPGKAKPAKPAEIREEHFPGEKEFYISGEKAERADALGKKPGRKLSLEEETQRRLERKLEPAVEEVALGAEREISAGAEEGRPFVLTEESAEARVRDYSQKYRAALKGENIEARVEDFGEQAGEIEARIEALTAGMSKTQRAEFLERWGRISDSAMDRAEAEGMKTKGASLFAEYDTSLNVLESFAGRLELLRNQSPEKALALLRAYEAMGPDLAFEAILVGSQRGGPTTGKLTITEVKGTAVAESVISICRESETAPEAARRVISGLSEEVIFTRLGMTREELIGLVDRGETGEALRRLNGLLAEQGVALTIIDGKLVPARVSRIVTRGRAEAYVVEGVRGMEDPISGGYGVFDAETKTILLKKGIEAEEITHEIAHYDQYISGLWEKYSLVELEAVAKATDLGFSKGLEGEVILSEILEISAGKRGKEYHRESADLILDWRPSEEYLTLREILQEAGVKAGDSSAQIRTKLRAWAVKNAPEGTSAAEIPGMIENMVKVRLRQFVDASYEGKLGVSWSDIFRPVVEGAPTDVPWRIEAARPVAEGARAGEKIGAPTPAGARERGAVEEVSIADRPEVDVRLPIGFVVPEAFRHMRRGEAIEAVRSRSKGGLTESQERYLGKQFETESTRFSKNEEAAAAGNLAFVLQGLPAELAKETVKPGVSERVVPMYYDPATGSVLGIGKKFTPPAGAERVDLVVNVLEGRITKVRSPSGENLPSSLWATSRGLTGLQVQEAVPGYDMASPEAVANLANKAAAGTLDATQTGYVKDGLAGREIHARDAEAVAANAAKTLKVFSSALAGLKASPGRETETVTAYYNRETGKIVKFGLEYSGGEPVEKIRLTVNLSEGKITKVEMAEGAAETSLFRERIKFLEGMQFREKIAEKPKPAEPAAKVVIIPAEEAAKLRQPPKKAGAPTQATPTPRDRSAPGGEQVKTGGERPEDVKVKREIPPEEKISVSRMEQLAVMADKVVYEGAERPAKLSPKEEAAFQRLLEGARKDKDLVDANAPGAKRLSKGELVRAYAMDMAATSFASEAERARYVNGISESHDYEGKMVDAYSNVDSVTVIGDGHGDQVSVFELLERSGAIKKRAPPPDPSYEKFNPAARKGRTMAEKYMDHLNGAYEITLKEGEHVVFLGDYFDRGPASMELFTAVRWLRAKAQEVGATIHMLRGNHEELFLASYEIFRGMSTTDMNLLLAEVTSFDFALHAKETEIRKRLIAQGGYTPQRAASLAFHMAMKELFDSGQFPRMKALDDAGIFLPNIGMVETLINMSNWYGNGLGDSTWWEKTKAGFESDGTYAAMNNLKGGVMLDNYYFTHGGVPSQIRSIEALDKYYTELFANPQNHWRTNTSAGPRLNYDTSYAGKDWNGNSPGVQEWRQGMADSRGKDEVFIVVGHSKDEVIYSEGPGVITADTTISSGYNRGVTGHGEALKIRPGESKVTSGRMRETAGGTRERTFDPVPEGLENDVSEADSIPIKPPTPPGKAQAPASGTARERKAETEEAEAPAPKLRVVGGAEENAAKLMQMQERAADYMVVAADPVTGRVERRISNWEMMSPEEVLAEKAKMEKEGLKPYVLYIDGQTGNMKDARLVVINPDKPFNMETPTEKAPGALGALVGKKVRDSTNEWNQQVLSQVVTRDGEYDVILSSKGNGAILFAEPSTGDMAAMQLIEGTPCRLEVRGGRIVKISLLEFEMHERGGQMYPKPADGVFNVDGYLVKVTPTETPGWKPHDRMLETQRDFRAKPGAAPEAAVEAKAPPKPAPLSAVGEPAQAPTVENAPPHAADAGQWAGRFASKGLRAEESVALEVRANRIEEALLKKLWENETNPSVSEESIRAWRRLAQAAIEKELRSGDPREPLSAKYGRAMDFLEKTQRDLVKAKGMTGLEIVVYEETLINLVSGAKTNIVVNEFRPVEMGGTGSKVAEASRSACQRMDAKGALPEIAEAAQVFGLIDAKTKAFIDKKIAANDVNEAVGMLNRALIESGIYVFTYENGTKIGIARVSMRGEAEGGRAIGISQLEGFADPFKESGRAFFRDAKTSSIVLDSRVPVRQTEFSPDHVAMHAYAEASGYASKMRAESRAEAAQADSVVFANELLYQIGKGGYGSGREVVEKINFNRHREGTSAGFGRIANFLEERGISLARGGREVNLSEIEAALKDFIVMESERASIPRLEAMSLAYELTAPGLKPSEILARLWDIATSPNVSPEYKEAALILLEKTDLGKYAIELRRGAPPQMIDGGFFQGKRYSGIDVAGRLSRYVDGELRLNTGKGLLEVKEKYEAQARKAVAAKTGQKAYAPTEEGGGTARERKGEREGGAEEVGGGVERPQQATGTASASISELERRAEKQKQRGNLDKAVELYEEAALELKKTDPAKASELYRKAAETCDADPAMRVDASASYYENAADLISETNPKEASRLYALAGARYRESAIELGDAGADSVLMKESAFRAYDNAILADPANAAKILDTPLLQDWEKAGILESVMDKMESNMESGRVSRTEKLRIYGQILSLCEEGVRLGLESSDMIKHAESTYEGAVKVRESAQKRGKETSDELNYEKRIAEMAVKAGEYLTAIEFYVKLAKNEGAAFRGDEVVGKFLGESKSFEERGEFEKAEKAYRGAVGLAESLDARSKYFELKYNIKIFTFEKREIAGLLEKSAEISLKANHNEEAANSYARAAIFLYKTDAERAAALYERAGDVYVEAGNPGLAAREYSEAAKIKEAGNQPGRAAELYEKAGDCYRQANQMAPSAQFYTNAAGLFEKAANPKKAAEMYENLSRHYISISEFQYANEAYSNAIRCDPSKAQFLEEFQFVSDIKAGKTPKSWPASMSALSESERTLVVELIKYQDAEVLSEIRIWESLKKDPQSFVALVRMNVIPLPELVEAWPERKDEIVARIKRKDAFQVGNELHLQVEYSKYLWRLKSVSKENEWYFRYDTFKRILQEKSKSPQMDEHELQYTLYEVQKSARELAGVASSYGDITVVGNMRTGHLYALPIYGEMGGAGTYDTARVGSTELHGEAYVLKPDLFSKGTTDRMLNKGIPCAVIDATPSAEKVPDAFKGYRAWAAGMDIIILKKRGLSEEEIIDRTVELTNMPEEVVMDIFNELKDPEHPFVKMANAWTFKESPGHESAPLIRVYDRDLDSVGAYRVKRQRVHEYENMQEIPNELPSGPVDGEVPLILFQPSMQTNKFPREVRESAGGKAHTKAYLDDQDSVIRLGLTFDEKGVELSANIAENVSERVETAGKGKAYAPTEEGGSAARERRGGQAGKTEEVGAGEERPKSSTEAQIRLAEELKLGGFRELAEFVIRVARNEKDALEKLEALPEEIANEVRGLLKQPWFGAARELGIRPEVKNITQGLNAPLSEASGRIYKKISDWHEQERMRAQEQKMGAAPEKLKNVRDGIARERDPSARQELEIRFDTMLDESARRPAVAEFIRGASEGEILELLGGRKSIRKISDEALEVMGSEVPVSDPVRFNALVEKAKALEDPYERELATKMLVRRTFSKMREILGPVELDAKGKPREVLPLGEMGYPEEQLAAVEFLRRFGVDPKIHEEIPWVREDFNTRVEIYYAVETFREGLTESLNRAFPGKEAEVTLLVNDIVDYITTQDVSDTNLPFTPHGWKHSLDVVGIGRDIYGLPGVKKGLIARYGSEERAMAAMDLVNILHDIGYGDLRPGESKGLHPIRGAEMFRDKLALRIADVFGINTKGRTAEQVIGGEPMIGDIYNAILLHGADKKGGKVPYTRASDAENPLLFIVRLADNLDMSSGRLRKIQSDPIMLGALKEMYDAANAVKQKNPIREGESREDYDKRLKPEIAAEINAIKAKYIVTPEMRQGFEAGEAGLPRFAEGRSFDDALAYSTFLKQMSENDWPHFVGCERVVRFKLREEIGDDGMPKLVIIVRIAGSEEAGQVGEGAGDGRFYQLWRAYGAGGSLHYGRELSEVELEAIESDLQGRYRELGIEFKFITVEEQEGYKTALGARSMIFIPEK